MFSPQGKLALMFLKTLTNLSDRKLYEQLNGNLQYQMFCDIFLGPEKLADFKVISRIRTQMAKQLEIRGAQEVLAEAWKPYLAQTNIVLEDATCYESYLHYPTNIKLLWECVLDAWSNEDQLQAIEDFNPQDEVSGAERKVFFLYA